MNYANREQCYKCREKKSDAPHYNAMEDTRNEIEEMMKQLQEERKRAAAVREETIRPILDSIIVDVFKSVESSTDIQDVPDSPVYHPPDSPVYQAPDSPLYCPPEETNGQIMFECTECQLRDSDRFEIYQHLEIAHGFPDDEEILEDKVRIIESKEDKDNFEQTIKGTDENNLVHNSEGSLMNVDPLDKGRNDSPDISDENMFMVENLEGLQRGLADDRDDLKLVINPEFSRTEEYKAYMEEYEKNNKYNVINNTEIQGQGENPEDEEG